MRLVCWVYLPLRLCAELGLGAELLEGSGSASCFTLSHLRGFLLNTGQGGRVRKQEITNPAMRMYMVCENCWQIYPQINPTNPNTNMIIWNHFSALFCPSKSMCVGMFLMKSGANFSIYSMFLLKGCRGSNSK